MNRYKNLILLLVIFGSIHLIVSGVVMPRLSMALIDEAFINQNKHYLYFAKMLRYSYLIIWAPVAFWIYGDSKKDMYAPLLWALLILIIHYQGVIIYFLIKLLTQKEKKAEISL